MAHLIILVFLSSWGTVAFSFPRGPFERISMAPRAEFESSASGPAEAFHGQAKSDRRASARLGLPKRGLFPRRAPSLASRFPFPAFLSRGRPAATFKAPLNPPQPKTPPETEPKKSPGLRMWQKAAEKGEKTTFSVPVNLKDAKQTCTAVPFTQHVGADGCEPVTVHNKLCFGQCSSLFVPAAGDLAGLRAPCSRCAPSKSRTVTVVLRCGAAIREKRVMVVEECKCETGREERNAEAADSPHLSNKTF